MALGGNARRASPFGNSLRLQLVRFNATAEVSKVLAISRFCRFGGGTGKQFVAQSCTAVVWHGCSLEEINLKGYFVRHGKAQTPFQA